MKYNITNKGAIIDIVSEEKNIPEVRRQLSYLVDRDCLHLFTWIEWDFRIKVFTSFESDADFIIKTLKEKLT